MIRERVCVLVCLCPTPGLRQEDKYGTMQASAEQVPLPHSPSRALSPLPLGDRDAGPRGDLAGRAAGRPGCASQRSEPAVPVLGSSGRSSCRRLGICASGREKSLRLSPALPESNAHCLKHSERWSWHAVGGQEIRVPFLYVGSREGCMRVSVGTGQDDPPRRPCCSLRPHQCCLSSSL